MLTKQEALNKIKELQEYVNEIYNEILVPEGIRFIRSFGNFSMGLLFNDNKQELMWQNNRKVFCVDPDPNTNLVVFQPKLIPCRREDLKTGDWVYRTNDKHDDFTRKKRYCLIDGIRFWYINDNQITKGHFSYSYDYWYKVVER